MNAAVVRRTQEALGKVIRRPPLTEKLLTKPPFRYLHDIITEVIRVTGFMKGLYTDAELKSDNVKDKDAKISFLQKAIDVVVMVSGEPLLVKPARIVAGHEPERTNELLQAIGKCCLSKLSSEEAVKRVLAGEKGDVKGRASLASRSQEPDNKNMREEEPQSRKEKEDRRSRDGKQREESKPRGKEEDGDGPRDSERDKHRAKADRERDREERRGEAGREERLRDRGKDRRRLRSGEHSRGPEREKADRKSASSGEIPKKSEGSFKDSRADMETEISRGASKSVTSKSSKRRSKNSVEGRKEDNVSTKSLDPIVSGLNSEPKRPAAAELGTEGASTNSTSVSDGNSPRLWRESAEPEPAARQPGDSASEAEGEAGPAGRDKSEVSESSEVPNEPASSARRIPRPGSARPAPPLVRRQASVEVLASDRAGSGKAVSSVIRDSQNGDSGEDDQFVVDAMPQPLELSPLETVPAAELEEDEKHGGLVKKILETKKDYEKVQQPARQGEKEKSLVFESAWKKEKDIVSKEMERLRASIQTLCKSALPLGKVMDYLQEDVDAMQNELQLWQGENRQHAQALQEEQSITDAAVEPLKAELAELEQLIKDQQDKICAVKASVLRNEEKIQKMIRSINLTAQKVDA
ncbi:TRAF3-interacting protein 1 [Ochotona princeps]|uniref:TRAF3-interacting protein 1 n=1 Tax=Ochotona princeps TaxID=9978 RepID=UPI002714EB35|nr:TRAF3-interacting protein 1 [Ochotona princeps]